MSTSQQKLQALTQQFQLTQQKMQEVIESRQKLESQSLENESVRAEFDAMDEDSSIYKLVGPVLVKQDELEAKQNVSRRIDLLQDETKRVEKELRSLQGETEKIKNEIIKIQQELQPAQAPEQETTSPA